MEERMKRVQYRRGLLKSLVDKKETLETLKEKVKF